MFSVLGPSHVETFSWDHGTPKTRISGRPCSPSVFENHTLASTRLDPSSQGIVFVLLWVDEHLFLCLLLVIQPSGLSLESSIS